MDKKYYFVLVQKRGKKDTQEYYHKDRRGWAYNVGSAILFAIISPIVYGSMGLIMPNQFWLSILAGVISGAIFFVIWRIGVSVYFLFEASRKLYEEKESELEKHNWNRIIFSVIPYSMFDISGWALRVENKKDFDLNQISINITQVRVNQQDIALLDKLYSLGYIDRSNGLIKEKICYILGSNGIEHGEFKDFVLTKKVQEIPYPTYEFDTYPDKGIPWPIEINIQDQTVALVQLEIRGLIKENSEINILPIKTMNLQIKKDGDVSII